MNDLALFFIQTKIMILHQRKMKFTHSDLHVHTLTLPPSRTHRHTHTCANTHLQLFSGIDNQCFEWRLSVNRRRQSRSLEIRIRNKRVRAAAYAPRSTETAGIFSAIKSPRTKEEIDNYLSFADMSCAYTSSYSNHENMCSSRHSRMPNNNEFCGSLLSEINFHNGFTLTQIE